MSSAPDFNIDNYSLEDLLELIGIDSVQTKESIRTAVNTAVRQFEKLTTRFLPYNSLKK